jgi:cation transport ATPase
MVYGPLLTTRMKNQLFFYILLVLLVLTDAWLLAHPNLLGKIGVWVYRYDYLKTFPRALATVSLATGATWILCRLVRQWLRKTIAVPVLWLLALAMAFLFVQTIVQFSSGSYAHTGAGFKTGAILLPFLLLIVVAQHLWETNRPQQAAAEETFLKK